MNKSYFNSFTLKWIAIITMLIDHIGSILFPDHLWLRFLGRLSFPIFCFLIVEGYRHTHNFKKYVLRLFIFALITEPIYDWAFLDTYWSLKRQNVLLTFVLGLLMLYVYERVREPYKMFSLVGFFVVAYFVKADYGIYGLLLILLLYLCFQNKTKEAGAIIIWNLLYLPSFQILGGLSSFFIYFY
ncbi:MAG TPA: conjugal transfer protein TraX, partial [Candidatus Dorea intestinavium]|nr:conjugal transfer protein TraX [Candidatus Dorea intestinavium]